MTLFPPDQRTATSVANLVRDGTSTLTYERWQWQEHQVSDSETSSKSWAESHDEAAKAAIETIAHSCAYGKPSTG